MKARGKLDIIAGLLAVAAVTMTAMAPQPAPADPTDRQAAIKQVAAFTERSRAMALVNTLSSEGRTAVILEKTVNSVDYYAVLVDSMPQGVRRVEIPAAQVENAPEPLPTPKPQEPVTTEEYFKDINEGPFEEVTLKPLYPDSKETITLMSNTPVYISPVENSPFIGTYRSLGGAQYAGVFDGWHSLWLPIENYGYVRSTDAKVTPNEPKPQ